jgi:hypothetical protein
MKNSEKKKATRPQKTKTPQTIIYVPPTPASTPAAAYKLYNEPGLPGSFCAHSEVLNGTPTNCP